MSRRFLLSFLLLALPLALPAQVVPLSWKADAMKGSFTGVKASDASNVKEAMGFVKGCTYYAPDGRKFRGGSVRKVAKIVIGAQPAMAHVKQVIGYSPADMVREYPECDLYDWFVDELMQATADSTGKKVDIGIANRGGIRIDMPKGDIFYDDIMSMFPFKNDLCYVSLYGRDVRKILEYMASTVIQPLGGVRIAVKDGKLVSAEVGGKPLDDGKVYGVATINFLLEGGDGLYLSRNALEVIRCKGYIYDTMLKHVKDLTAAGKKVEYKMDGRVRILGEGESL